MQQQRTAQEAFIHRKQQQAMLAHQQGGMGMGFLQQNNKRGRGRPGQSKNDVIEID